MKVLCPSTYEVVERVACVACQLQALLRLTGQDSSTSVCGEPKLPYTPYIAPIPGLRMAKIQSSILVSNCKNNVSFIIAFNLFNHLNRAYNLNEIVHLSTQGVVL